MNGNNWTWMGVYGGVRGWGIWGMGVLVDGGIWGMGVFEDVD